MKLQQHQGPKRHCLLTRASSAGRGLCFLLSKQVLLQVTWRILNKIQVKAYFLHRTFLEEGRTVWVPLNLRYLPDSLVASWSPWLQAAWGVFYSKVPNLLEVLLKLPPMMLWLSWCQSIFSSSCHKLQTKHKLQKL